MLSVTSLKQVKEPARLPYCYTRNTSVQHFLGANKLNTGNTEVHNYETPYTGHHGASAAKGVCYMMSISVGGDRKQNTSSVTLKLPKESGWVG